MEIQQKQIENGIPKLIDTHSHVNFFDFDKDREETISRTLAENIWMINVGTNLRSSQRAVEIAGKNPSGIFASVGLHPTDIRHEGFEIFSGSEDLEKDFDVESYRLLARNERVVAVGEIGLDYYYKPKDPADLPRYKAKQKEVFEKQLDFAEEQNLPVIIHCRDAHDEMIAILEQTIVSGSPLEGVIHCFNGTLSQAKKYLALGFFIGINGIIFKMNMDETVKNIPLDKMILETDCPFLVPPMAPSKRNEPCFVHLTAEKIAEIKGIDFGTVAETTTKNAKKLFKLKN